MTRLTDVAKSRQAEIDRTAMDAAARVAALWSAADPTDLEREWTYRAPEITSTVTNAQIAAATGATEYVSEAAAAQGRRGTAAQVAAVSFGGVTKEGRQVGPELYTGVTRTKSLIGQGMGVGDAFRVGTAMMTILAANTVRDAGRSADGTVSVSRGMKRYVRVVQPGACSRCAILAGVSGYREAFDRHPGCRCTSMWIYDDEVPDGFFRDAGGYFNSLSEAEQDRVFTKAGAWAIRNGADAGKVVNARRGMYKTSIKHADGSYGPAKIRPVTIGVRPDGSPLQVYATLEGTTSRGDWGRMQTLDVRHDTERYRRTSTLRLMPEQIMKMSGSPERARELLQKYGYIY